MQLFAASLGNGTIQKGKESRIITRVQKDSFLGFVFNYPLCWSFQLNYDHRVSWWPVEFRHPSNSSQLIIHLHWALFKLNSQSNYRCSLTTDGTVCFLHEFQTLSSSTKKTVVGNGQWVSIKVLWSHKNILHMELDGELTVLYSKFTNESFSQSEFGSTVKISE